MDHCRRPASLPYSARLLHCSLASAQADKVDDYIKDEMQRRKVPGLSLAVVRSGEVVQAKGYGLANAELNVAATPETIYQSGSVGKQFPATLVMMLVEEGKLSLDDHIGKHIAGVPAGWKDITLRHLLTHNSGFSNSLYEKINMRPDYTEDELVQQFVALPPDFPPGEKWSYSNPGYVMLGILVHKATGKFYGDELQPGFVITISRDGDGLTLQATGQPRPKLFAELEKSFFFKVGDAQITFVKDVSGKVTHLVLHPGGGDQEVKKVR